GAGADRRAARLAGPAGAVRHDAEVLAGVRAQEPQVSPAGGGAAGGTGPGGAALNNDLRAWVTRCFPPGREVRSRELGGRPFPDRTAEVRPWLTHGSRRRNYPRKSGGSWRASSPASRRPGSK